MKFTLVSILLFWSFTSYCQQYWLNVSSPVDKSLYRSQFLDTINGWAAGDSGTIVHTSNSGVNWVQQPSGISLYGIDDIFFTDQNTGWALSNDFLFTGTIVLKTTNGGANWTNSRYPDSSLVLNVIYFVNSFTGYLTGYSGVILKTTNSGTNWFNCNIDTSFCPFLYLFPKNKIYFINNNTGFVCGGQMDIQGMIWRTTNAGNNWYTYCVASEPLFDITALTPSRIIATGGDFEYGLSTVTSGDGGASWAYELNNITGRGLSIAYRTPKEVWVPLNFAQTFVVNTDSGNQLTEWKVIEAPDSTKVNSVLFMSPTFGWSFGSGGKIYKYNTAVIGIEEGSQNIPEQFYLNQNYPNPFNPSTTISYRLSGGGLTKVEIYDLTGRLTELLFNSYQAPGYHEISWNAKERPSGIYFCRVSAGSIDKTIKMLLIK